MFRQTLLKHDPLGKDGTGRKSIQAVGGEVELGLSVDDDPVVVPTATTLPPQAVSEPPARAHVPARPSAPAYYVSIVHGTATLDTDWPACAARVRGVSGAQYRKVRTLEELAAFCAAHGVEPPQGLT